MNQHSILLDMGLGPIWLAKNAMPTPIFTIPMVAPHAPSALLDTPPVIIPDSHALAMLAPALEEQQRPQLAAQADINATQISTMNAEQLAEALSTLAPAQQIGEGNPQGRLLILLEQDYSSLENHAMQLLHNILKASQCPIESVYFSALHKIPNDSALNQAILRQQIQLCSANYILCFSTEAPPIEHHQTWISAPSLSHLQQASAKAALWQQLCMLNLNS